MKLNRKGYARIYVSKKEDIVKVKKIIKEIDEFEYDYITSDLITVFDGTIEHVYNGKFDSIDMDDLMAKCWDKGVYCFYTINPDYPHIP